MTCPKCRGTGFYYDRGFPAECDCEGPRGRGGAPSREQWEEMVRDAAHLFKVVRKIAPATFDRWEFPTEQEAREFAQREFRGDRRSMIYGVTPDGRSVMLGNM